MIDRVVPGCLGRTIIEFLTVSVLVIIPLSTGTAFLLQKAGIHLVGFMVLQNYSRIALGDECQIEISHRRWVGNRANRLFALIPGYQRHQFVGSAGTPDTCLFQVNIWYYFPKIFDTDSSDRKITLEHTLSKPTPYRVRTVF